MRQAGKSCNTCEMMSIRHEGRSQAVDIALVDFGSDHSFDEAALIFKRHYKFSISDATIRRLTQSTGEKVEQFIERKLSQYEEADLQGTQTKPPIDTVFLGFDGCSIRTGVLEKTHVKTARGRIKSKRIEEWRDVRLGFARPPEGQKVFIGGMTGFPVLMEKLFNLSLGLGMNENTKPVAISDGGNGLYEALDQKFCDLQFILDYYHFKEHLYGTAKEMGLDGKVKEEWVCSKSDMAWQGQVDELLNSLEMDYERTQIERIRQLKGYISRFKNSISYGKFKEAGFPIGSGEIESAHKWVTQKRLKLPGACWRPERVNPMLALRIIKANDWWDEFWEIAA